MDNIIYQKKEYVIFKACNGYVVYNQNKEFQEGHTHFKSFNKAKSCIDLALRFKVPSSESIRFLNSLCRISMDRDYISKLEELINTKKQKGKKQNYYNRKEV